ncbi:hypothetical protein E2562_035525 [Oryza meyeriana var. granulata]|uniref:Uncharacterized protein n=1 Tax=Oryza meyeriana var. granulata TaxID=110450 RepID=A0A6G1E7Q4_9ORYZ|nr:hypothetical protein E2562_035525 [Oryza meyeriana var. granulata]
MLPATGDTLQHLAIVDFYSNGRRCSIILPAPAIQSRLCIGSTNGWLLTSNDECELQLLNPIFGVQFSLLSIITTSYFDAL